MLDAIADQVWITGDDARYKNVRRMGSVIGRIKEVPEDPRITPSVADKLPHFKCLYQAQLWRKGEWEHIDTCESLQDAINAVSKARVT